MTDNDLDFEKELELLTQDFTQKIDENVVESEKIEKQCDQCKKTIDNQYIEAEGKNYHTTCFICSVCLAVIGEGKYTRINNKLSCHECYQKSILHCCQCNKPITKKLIEFDGKNYHDLCFTCAYCDIVLDGISFSVDDNSRIACVTCYSKENMLKCTSCNDYILAKNDKIECIDFDGHKFHVECFKCSKCGCKQDEKCSLTINNSIVYCHDCINKNI